MNEDSYNENGMLGAETAKQNYLVTQDEVITNPGIRNVGAQPLLAYDMSTDGNGLANIQRFIEHQPDGFNSRVGVALVGDEGTITGKFMPHYGMLKYRLRHAFGEPYSVTILPDGRIMRKWRLPEFGANIPRVPFSGLFGTQYNATELLYGTITNMSVESSRSGEVGGSLGFHFNRLRRAQDMPVDEPQNAIYRVVGRDVDGVDVVIGAFLKGNYLGTFTFNNDDDEAAIKAAVEALPQITTAVVTETSAPSKPEGLATLNSHPINSGTVLALALNNDAVTAQDASTNNIDGTPNAHADFADGEFGKVLNFDGTAGLLDLGNDPKTQLVAQMTLYARCKAATNADINYLLTKSGAAGTKSFELSTNAAGRVKLVLSANGTAVTTVTATTGVANDGDWHDVAATYDGVTVKLYLDGVLVGSQAANLLLFNTASHLAFGGFADGSQAATEDFEGDLDIVRVWNRALSQSELALLADNPYLGVLVDGDTISAMLNRIIDIEITAPGDSVFEFERFEGKGYFVYAKQFGSDGGGLLLAPGVFLEPDHVLRYKASSRSDLDSIKMGITAPEGAAGPDKTDPHIIKTAQAGAITYDGLTNALWYEDREKGPSGHNDGDVNVTASITLAKDKAGRCEEIYATDNREGGCAVTPWYYRQAFRCGQSEVWFDTFVARNAQPDFPVENNQLRRQFPLVRIYNPAGSAEIVLISPATVS